MNSVNIEGTVHYKSSNPVNGAIVILEMICDSSNKKSITIAHTVTNSQGEFHFLITDKTSCYKIKVFDNQHRLGGVS